MNIGISVKIVKGIMFKKKCANCGHPSKFHIGDHPFDKCNVDIIDHFGAHNGVPYGKAYRCTCKEFRDGD